MTYTELLNQIIQESEISANQICKRCKEMGVDLKPSYLSQLRNDEGRRASDDIAIAIAKVCGKPDDLLIVQACLDDAPATLHKLLDRLRAISAQAILAPLKGVPHNEIIEGIKSTYENMSTAEYLIEATESDRQQVQIAMQTDQSGERMLIGLKTEEAGHYEMPDDSMLPLIPQDSMLRLQAIENINECQNNDVLACIKNEDKSFQVRRMVFLNDKTQVITIPQNRAYPSEILNIAELSILGKVSHVTWEL